MTARSIRFWQTAAFATPKRASEYRTPLSQQYVRTHEARRETLSSLVRGYIDATFVREWVGFWFRSAVPRSGSLNSGNDGASVVPPPLAGALVTEILIERAINNDRAAAKQFSAST